MTGSDSKSASSTSSSLKSSSALFTALKNAGVLPGKVTASLENVADLAAIKTLAETHGQAADPFLLPLVTGLLQQQMAKTDAIKTATYDAAVTIVKNLAVTSIKPVLLPILAKNLDSKANKWQVRVAALNLIQTIAAIAPDQTANCLAELVPLLSDSICDARAEVAAASEKAMLVACQACGNPDLEKVIPAVVSSMARPVEVAETIHLVSATTFVKAVETPTLAVLVPLLARGLTERATSTKRMTAVIIENMTKLVLMPEYAAPLIPKLLPGLQKLKDEVSDPECRNVATRCYGSLLKVAKTDEAAALAAIAAANAKNTKPKAPVKKPAGKGAAAAATPVVEEPAPLSPMETETAALMAGLKEAFGKHGVTVTGVEGVSAGAGAGSSDSTDFKTLFETAVLHVAMVLADLALTNQYDAATWAAAVVGFLSGYITSPVTLEAIAADLRKATIERRGANDGTTYIEEEDDGTPDLCKAEFSLAYGAKTLLNSAKLHLKVGKKYGLIGPERCGKSTMLRAIANGQLEGFPSKDEVRTVYVESTISAEDADMTVFDYCMKDPDVISGGADDEVVLSTLTSLGFTPAMLAGEAGRLSGGWRCKLALARAQLSRSDIYLMDEPTNHLDKKNVAWIIDYLNSLTTTTCIMVSHDSNFLDQTCYSMIHFEGFALRQYRGNLSEFVKHHPEAQSYYELSASTVSFNFPQPGFLEGIKSKDRAIIKIQNASITYPGRDTPVISGVNVNCSLSSRVVVLGANGAGKSTLIKTIVGEMMASEGIVWRHPNVRIAYVAQDAFHHLNHHLKSTPSEYIQWRYATGEDREAQQKASAKITADDEKKMAETVSVLGLGSKLVISQVLNRRKSGKSYEYEVEFVGQSPDKNQWMPREWLVEKGWGKSCDAIDSREAAALGLHSRPLTAANISAHMAAVGLDPEQTLHSRISTLSGGQLIKVVIGAAMWMNPHILIMDEPTNFLDRDSLGALAGAIKAFEGGVLLITHHHDFTKELCGETWTVGDGKVLTVGQSWDTSIIEKPLDADETVDAHGNTIKVQKKLTGKLLKAYKKEKAARRKRGEDVSSDEEDYA